MSKVKNLLEKITNYNSDARNTEVREVINDKGIPLDDRWDVYTKAVDSGYLESKDGWYFIPFSLECTNRFTLYDSAYVDKYQTYDYTAFFHYFTQNGRTIESEKELVAEVKEEIMATGKSHWVNDW